MANKLLKTNEQWRDALPADLYHIAREKGTERPFTGVYTQDKRPGMFFCACCDAPLFDAARKFDSGSGWPSFTQPANPEAVEEHRDHSHGMVRTEVTCQQCGAHLGHVFPDGPGDGGLRYCINSRSLRHEQD